MGREPLLGAGHVDSVMGYGAVFVGGIWKGGCCSRVYMELYETEGWIRCMHLQDSGIYKLYREKCEGVVWI